MTGLFINIICSFSINYFFCTVMKGERIYNKTMRTLFISIGILAPHLTPLFFIWMVDIPIQA